MEIAKYEEILSELEMFISIGTSVSNRLVGTTTNDMHQSYADPIFSKLICHAISLHKLSPQIKKFNSTQIWDVPSACAVARCIIDAYDVLEYIALVNTEELERSFRLLVWRTHDQQRRSHMLHSIQSKNPIALEIHAQANELVRQAEQHPWFSRIEKNIQNRIKNGDAPSFLISHKQLNAANGVNHEYYVSAKMMLSQHVHTFPMATHQLLEFKAGTPEALHLSSMPIQYSLGYLARAIRRMAEMFLHGDLDITDEQSLALEVWIAVVEKGVNAACFSNEIVN